MHKHRISIILPAALAIISSFLPWASLNAGTFGSYSISGTQGGDGWFIIVLSIGAIVLACLPNINSPMNKNFSIGVIVIGALELIITLVNIINVGQYAVNFGDYGVSIGFGLISAVLASIATIVRGLLAMSGGKITKGTFQELASTGRGFAQSVASSVQSPQQPGQPGQQQWQQPQQGFGQPAPGQGILCIQCRENDNKIRHLLEIINDDEVTMMCEAEREFSKIFEGGCHTPIGCSSVIEGDTLKLKGMFNDNGSRILKEVL